MKKLQILIWLFLWSFCGNAQTKYASENKKALKYYEEARQFFKRTQFYEALEPLKKAIDKDDNFIEAWNTLGTAYFKTGKKQEAKESYIKAIRINPDYPRSVNTYFLLGELYYKEGLYQEAISYLENYLTKKTKNSKSKKVSRRYIDNSKFAIEAIASPYEYNQKPLKDHANYFKLQYFPVLTVDEKTLIFTGRKGLRPRDDEDIYISRKDELGNWSIPSSVSNNINTPLNEGACTISADGRTLIFTACTGRKGYGSCDLFISYKIGDHWTNPENMGETVNSSSWDVQPSLSADGTVLYFVSTRKGGIGGKDIWVSHKNIKGKWQTPLNLGNKVNTIDDEISPFIHVNGESLFFSSKGHIGMGGYDIFKSEKLNDTTWSESKNLGFPLNDKEDQVSLYISSNGKKGYYTVEKRSFQDWDSWLYEFDVPNEISIQKKSTFLTGNVKDAETGKFLKSDIKLYELHSNEIKSRVESDAENGDFVVVLTEGNEYGMYVSKEGYLFQDFSFSFNNFSDFDKELLNIELTPVNKGQHMVLSNLYFEFDKFELKPESYSELEILLEFLKKNSSVKIEIQGYTDNVGGANYNLNLSSKRAETVYDYLEKKGVPQTRLSYKGYGSSNPILPNDSEKNRTKNRRIEFQIVE